MFPFLLLILSYFLYILEIMLVEDPHPSVPSWWIVPFAWGVRLWFSLVLSNDGLAWWSSGEGATCQCRRHSFDPWSGKIPQATGQLSPRATTAAAPVLQTPESTTRETTTVRSLWTTTGEQPPLAATRESPGAAVKTQHNQNKFF